jgi:hypothetical protein
MEVVADPNGDPAVAEVGQFGMGIAFILPLPPNLVVIDQFEAGLG